MDLVLNPAIKKKRNKRPRLNLNLIEIKKFLSEGLSASKIAKKLNVARHSVTRFITKNKLNPNFKRSKRLSNNESAFITLYNGYKNSAKVRELDFSLSKEDFKSLIFNNCVYCGEEPLLKKYPNSDLRFFILYNTIDRVDSAKGYILSNCVSACKFCNISKYTLSKDEFLNKIEKIYLFTKGQSI